MTSQPAESPLVIAVAQVATVPGALAANADRIADAWQHAREAGADVVLTPELALTGYAPRDLVFREGFLGAVAREEARLAALTSDGPALVIGSIHRRDEGASGRGRANVAVVFEGGKTTAVVAKRLLPEYDVFDEARYFEPGSASAPVMIAGHPIGLTICEDLWVEEPDRPELPRYASDPAGELAAAGASIILSLSASPFARTRARDREELVRGVARRTGMPVILANLVGGHEELIFDGASVAATGDGTVSARARAFAEDLMLVDLGPQAAPPEAWPADEDLVRAALVTGIRDYAHRSGFRQAVIGLSGGIDSALVASLAAEALGPENLLGVGLPSGYSSEGSLTDARDLADLLGIAFAIAPIEDSWQALRRAARSVTGEGPFGLMEENLQSRARGTILMAIANESGRLLLTTGNKSEIAVGYCTLYGDMNGGLAPIADLWKTEVFALAAREVAAGRIPRNSLEKPPSAELRPDQLDEDSLPPYERLDRILRGLVEDELEPETIARNEKDVSETEVRDVLKMIARNEWKRRQAAPGLRVSRKAFGTGRRIPLVHADPSLSRRDERS